MPFGSLVTIITNLPPATVPATYEASRSCRLFVSNLLHSFYCFEYNFTVTVTLHFHINISWLMINFKTEHDYWIITEYYAFTIRVDQVNFLREKFGVLAYSQDWLVLYSKLATVTVF